MGQREATTENAVSATRMNLEAQTKVYFSEILVPSFKHRPE